MHCVSKKDARHLSSNSNQRCWRENMPPFVLIAYFLQNIFAKIIKIQQRLLELQPKCRGPFFETQCSLYAAKHMMQTKRQQFCWHQQFVLATM